MASTGVDAHFHPPIEPAGLSVVLAFDNGQTNIQQLALLTKLCSTAILSR